MGKSLKYGINHKAINKNKFEPELEQDTDHFSSSYLYKKVAVLTTSGVLITWLIGIEC